MHTSILLLLLSTYASAQAHGSPNGVPIPVADPNAISPSINPSDIVWASWVDPAHLSPATSTPPAPPAASQAPESSPGDIFVCTDSDFKGVCEYMHSVTYVCNNFGDKYAGLLSSIRPDKGQLCLFYDKKDCFGDADWIRWPGSSNMRGRRFDDRAQSWKCSDDNCDGTQGPGGCHENPDGTPKTT
jgi:hypothetical protein